MRGEDAGDDLRDVAAGGQPANVTVALGQRFFFLFSFDDSFAFYAATVSFDDLVSFSFLFSFDDSFAFYVAIGTFYFLFFCFYFHLMIRFGFRIHILRC